MFKPSLFKKLFLVLLFCMLIISATILASVHWSFSRGFGEYLLKAEATQLDKLVTLLEQTYAKDGSWQNLQNNREAWFGLLHQGLEEKHLFPDALNGSPADDFPPPHLEHHQHPPPMFGDHPDGHPPPHFGGPHFGPPPEEIEHDAHPPKMLSKFLGSRLQLLDAEKHPVVGLAKTLDDSVLRPIQQGKQIVGWLALQPSDLINNHLAQLFVTQQIRNNYRIAGLVLCLAVLGSLLVTRKLLIPIKRITAGAKALVTGDYGTQIKSSSTDELGQLASDFNLLARTLQSNEQARKHWIADISHELRTPLAILRGEIEAVQDGVREISQDNIQSLHNEVISLTQLVDDLYELSLSDLGSSHYQLTLVDLGDCLEDVVQSLLPRFQESGLDLRLINPSSKAILVQADNRRLRQLFLNVLENSRRYSNAGGFCEISVHCTNTHVIVNFEDTPPGVPEWSLEKLFDRLYRVDKSRNRELGGSGLGLAICQTIVNAHRGDIQAFHSAYGGLGIKITLPLKGSQQTR